MKTLTVKGTVFGEGMPKICLPIMGKTESEIMETAGRISGLPHDVVEWRADAFQHFSSHRQVIHILAALRQVLPDSLLLFTFRTLREGGKHDISDEAYLALNEAVIRSGLADFVDLELFTGTEAVAAAELPAPEDFLLAPLISLARQTQVQTILSSHDFAKTPPMGELLERLSAMEALGCSIAKLAVMPHKKKDVLTLLSATLEASERLDCPVITMSMGALGVISRICGEFFGSCLTFGNPGEASAPGQPDAETLSANLRELHGIWGTAAPDRSPS